MITEISGLSHQSPGTVLSWMPVHLTCVVNRFLAAGQGPALLSIQEPVLTKFHYCQGCPVQMKTWLLWSWRLDSTISTFGKRAQRQGRSCRQGFQKQLIIALQFSQNKTRDKYYDAFFNFLPHCHCCQHGKQICSTDCYGLVKAYGGTCLSGYCGSFCCSCCWKA